MFKSLIKEKGEISMHGAITLSTDPQLINRLVLLSICTKNEIIIKPNLTNSLLNPLNELIRFIGGSYSAKKELIYQVKDINTILIPHTIIPDFNLRFMAMMAILGRKNEAGMEIANLDDYDKKLFEIYYKNLKLFPFSTKISKNYFIIKNNPPLHDQLVIDGSKLSYIEVYGFTLFALGTNKPLTIINPVIDEYTFYILNQLKESSIVNFVEKEITINSGLPTLTFNDLPGSTIELLSLLILTVYWKGDLSIINIKQTQIIGLLNIINRIGIPYKIEGETLRIWCDPNTKFKPINFEEKGFPGLIGSWIEIISLLSTQVSGEINIKFKNPNLFGEYFRAKSYGLNIIPNNDQSFLYPKTFKLIGPSKVNFENSDLNLSRSKILPLILSLIVIEPIELKGFELISDVLPDLIPKLIKLGLSLKVVEY